MVGTPELVPEPSTVILRSFTMGPFRLTSTYPAMICAKRKRSSVNGVIESPLLFPGQIAFGLRPAAWRADRCCGAPIRNRAAVLSSPGSAEWQHTEIQLGLQA